jgi:hypothetical protein
MVSLKVASVIFRYFLIHFFLSLSKTLLQKYTIIKKTNQYGTYFSVNTQSVFRTVYCFTSVALVLRWQ